MPSKANTTKGASPREESLSSFVPEAVSPLYHQIKEYVTRQIVSGHWRTNHELPSEGVLCKHFAVSRGTLRQALDDLENRGLIVRRQGRGTFVAQPKFEGSVLGSYNNFRVGALPHDPVSQLLGIERRRATADLQQLLQIGKRDFIYDVKRLDRKSVV